MNSIIDDTLKLYKSTAESKNVEAHVALYDQNVFVFDMWEQWSFQGAAAHKSMAEEWFTSVGEETLKIDFENVLATVKPEIAFGSATIKYSAISPEGNVLRWLQNRMTLVLEKKTQGWKIIHQHTSCPVDSNSLKAILKA